MPSMPMGGGKSDLVDIDRFDLWSEYSGLSRFAGLFDLNAKRLSFRSLTAGRLAANPEEQVRCMVRCIDDAGNCALWLKNEGYQWSLIHEGKEPKELGAFVQVIPDLAPGRYSIAWFDPQTGTFFEKKSEEIVKEDGALSLSVPSFSKDLACLLTRMP